MDLVLFAGFLVAAGHYVNGGNFEGFQPRAVLVRKNLPENEVLSGDDNVYRSRMLERSQKYVQDMADTKFAEIQLQKLKMKTDIKDIQGLSENVDDSFAMYPFNEEPDYRASRRSLDLNKLSRFRTEGFVPGSGVPDATTSRGEYAQWNGPEMPAHIDEANKRIQADKIARGTLTGIQDGVKIDQIQDRPLLEHETYLLPKTSDQLRVKPLNNYTIDHVMPEGVLREAPPILPEVSRRLETVFETNDAFFTPSTTFGDATALYPESTGRDLKKDKTFTARLNAGGVAAGLERNRERDWEMNSFKLGNRSSYDTLTFERPTSTIDAHPHRNVKVPRTRKEELNRVNYLALDGLQDRGSSRRQQDAPRVTQRETINIDGRLASSITAPYQHPAFDITNVEMPRPTNKENNMTAVVGLPGVGNSASIRNFDMDLPPTLKENIAMRSFAYTSPANSMVENMPVAGTSAKHSKTLKYFESRQPNLDNPVNAPALVGDNDRKQSALRGIAMEWNAPLDMTTTHEQYAGIERASDTFEKYTRKPTEFY